MNTLSYTDGSHAVSNATNEIEMEELDIASSGVVIEAANHPETVVCHVKHLNRISVLSAIASMAYVGVCLRLATITLFTFIQAKASLFPVVCANFVGCFIMGLLSDHKAALAKFYSPLAVALQTGFCGSLTSFSTVLVSSSNVIFGFGNCELNALQRGLIFVENYVVNFFVSFLLFLYGRQLSHKPVIEHIAIKMAASDERSVHSHALLFTLNAVFYAATTITLVVVAIVAPGSRYFTVAMLLGQVGAITRYYVGKHLNPVRPFFPIGTFLVNILGSAISGVVSATSLYLTNEVDSVVVMFLTAVANGFCGAVTTVSTFAAETALLPDMAKAIRYTSTSVIGAQILVILPYIFYQFFFQDAKPMLC